MKKSSIRLLSQVYLLVILLAATALSSLPYSLLALALLLVMLFSAFRPPQPRFNILIIMLVIFLLPLVVEPLIYYLTYTTPLSTTVIQLIAVTAALPTIYLLDYHLRRNAETMTIVHGSNTTTILNTLLATTVSMLLVSLIVNNFILQFIVLALTLYLLVILVRLLYTIPSLPLDIPYTWKRLIAGTTVNVPLYATNKASIRLHTVVRPTDSWVRITPQRFMLGETKIELKASVTPSLAGSSCPRLLASFLDPWGFVQLSQIITPLELHIIPRARYAGWLAMRYLEQTGSSSMMAAAPLTEAILRPRKGVEYYDSRRYQAGDSLKDIDWKHTVKLSQIIVKKYIEVGGKASIIAVNLSVADAEEADKLAFNLITAAVTLARESIPTALAVYNYQKVVLNTPVSDPRQILKQALLLVKEFTSVELVHRFLEPPDISRIRRNIALLKQVTSKPAQQLLTMLNFEYESIKEAVKNHPATLTLLRASKHVQPPALIVLLSQLNHDAEALMVVTEKLSKRGFTRLRIGATELNPRRIL